MEKGTYRINYPGDPLHNDCVVVREASAKYGYFFDKNGKYRAYLWEYLVLVRSGSRARKNIEVDYAKS